MIVTQDASDRPATLADLARRGSVAAATRLTAAARMLASVAAADAKLMSPPAVRQPAARRASRPGR
jgi:hypothetical protein